MKIDEAVSHEALSQEARHGGSIMRQRAYWRSRFSNVVRPTDGIPAQTLAVNLSLGLLRRFAGMYGQDVIRVPNEAPPFRERLTQ